MKKKKQYEEAIKNQNVEGSYFKLNKRNYNEYNEEELFN